MADDNDITKYNLEKLRETVKELRGGAKGDRAIFAYAVGVSAPDGRFAAFAVYLDEDEAGEMGEAATEELDNLDLDADWEVCIEELELELDLDDSEDADDADVDDEPAEVPGEDDR